MSNLLASAAIATMITTSPGLIVNMFAGGGGTAEGIHQGMGRPTDVNINHDGPAIAMHAANHPHSQHYREDVWGVDPKAACDGQDVDLLWLSPDCRHFSKAKGGQPVKKEIRGLANVAVKWAHAVKIRQGIMLENVEEFETWGPLIETEKGMMPCPVRKGEYFRRWKAALRRAGATSIEHRNLRACDYGAPTIRKRLFLIARFDGKAIVWPKPTHGHRDSAAVKSGKLLPFKTAADCIDWSIDVPSIFGRSKDLADATLRRIAAGVMRYVINAAEPFIVPVTHTKAGGAGRPTTEPLATITTAKGGELALVKPTLVKAAHIMTMRSAAKPWQGCDEPTDTITSSGAHQFLVEATMERAEKVAAFMAQHNGGFYNGDGRPVDEPLSTITQAGSNQQLVTANIVKLRGTCADGQPVDEPAPTLTAGGSHVGLVYAFLVKYYGAAAHGQSLDDPLHTATHQARFGLVTVTINSEAYVITDIGMRMLTPRELARAQGFPDSYILDPVCEYETKSGKKKVGPLPIAQQIAKIGNSVCPVMAKVLTAANFGPEANDYDPGYSGGHQFNLFEEAA